MRPPRRERTSPARPRILRDGNLHLRALNRPRPINVEVDGSGTPVEVRMGRRRLRIEEVREDWRIDDEWWRRPIARHYREVVLEDGGILTLYQDLLDRRWYAQGS